MTLDSLVATELIDQIQFCPYRAIGSGIHWCERCATSRNFGQPGRPFTERLAISIQERNGEAAEQNAALIARHFESAGELARGLLVVHACRDLAVSTR